MQMPNWRIFRSRKYFNTVFGWAAALLAVVTLAGLAWRIVQGENGEAGLCWRVVTAFWVMAPPVFFWCDWVFFADSLDEEERKVAEHTHDLGRNIWLGLVGILVYALFKR